MNSSASEAGLQIVPSISTIREARKFLARYFAPTRLIPAPFLKQTTGRNVYLKVEAELPTGSFKVRGAFWALAQTMNRADRGSSGLQHRESRSGGGLRGETLWNQGKDFFAGELQSGEAWPHCGARRGDCGERRRRLGVGVRAGRGVRQAAGRAFSERRDRRGFACRSGDDWL